MSDLRKNLIDTFEYIKQLVLMGQEPVFSVSEYRNVKVLESDLYALPGVNHAPDSEDGGQIWLEIERLHKGKAPPPVEMLEPWLNQSHQPGSNPTLKKCIIVTASSEETNEMFKKGVASRENVLESPREQGKFDIRLFAKDNTKLEIAFDNYLKKKWLPWAAEEKPRRETIAIYEKFFSLNQTMMAGEVEQPIEVVWGIGYVVWKIPKSDKCISHPLLETLVEIELASDTQTLKIRPRSVTRERPQLFTAPYEALQISGVKPLKEYFEKYLHQLEAEGKTIQPTDPTSFVDILKNAVSLLSKDAYFVPDVVKDVTIRSLPRPEESLAITDTWAIYARARRSNYLVQDLEHFQEKAKSDEKIEGSVAIKFVKQPSAERPNIDGWGLGLLNSQSGSGSLVGEISQDREKSNTIYFPKPFNDAQRDIIERLEKADGVVVQGPPGTGKTHTIANIVCHYLATGRRVLVTAKSETALEVLKSQIPNEVQPLIISMVSNDREGLQQQKTAIETLQVKVVGLQGREKQIYREIEIGEEEVSRLQQDIQKIDLQVEDFARKQLEPMKLEWANIDFENMSDLATWVVENRDNFIWFPDELGPDEKYTPLFDDEDIKKLIHAKQVVGEEIEYLNTDIPAVNDLPDTETIGRIHQDLVTAMKLESMALREDIPRFKDESIETIKTADLLVREIKEIQHWIRKTDTTWLKIIFECLIYPYRQMPSWLELLDELRPELNSIVKERKKYLRKPVDHDANGAAEQAVLRAAVGRGKSGKRPLSVLKSFNKRTKSIVKSITILGKEAVSKEDWDHIEGFLFFEDRCNELVVRWNAIANEAPIPKCELNSAAKTFEVISDQLKEAECFAIKHTQNIWMGIDKVLPKTSGFYRIEPKHEDLNAAVHVINQNLSMVRLSKSESVRSEAIRRLERYDCNEAKELINLLTKSIGSEDLGNQDIQEIWRSKMARLRDLKALASNFETIHEVTEKLRKSGAINWSSALRQEIFSELDREHLLNWKEVWRWARLNTVLRLRDVQDQLISLEANRQEKESRMKQVFEDVVKKRTFLMLCQSMSDQAKSGLAKFMSAISNVGRGTGIKAPIFLRAAQKAMLQCAEAIPCWIMPSWRVSEVLPAEFNFFNLVIVDEASQCDIRELPAIARGEKLLIVGDDRQVSPTAPFVEFKKFLQLKHNYLGGHPFEDIMLPGYSLYDLASAVFPGNKTILNEHFRCVEPIIRFSFQFYKGVTIHPLRIPKVSERIDPPLVDIMVENGLKKGDLNYEEAEVIIDEIEKLISENRYEARSIGVISLIGRKQAAFIQKKLLDRIGQEKYLKHRIICGDSATFQGREREIIFLSMVASPGQSRALTMRINEQRFNVAASRARDRLYLVRSVGLDELTPGDLKAKLIRHFQEPMPVRCNVDKELVELCDSSFERKVFAELTNRGYRAIPQVPVGNYRIDIVVEGNNDRRLAIELDGDQFHGPEKWLEDWTRQKVLERVGWKFWRCWASSYKYNPEGCLKSLIQKLETMEIFPQGNQAKSFAYTEFRSVNTTLNEPEEDAIEALESDEVIAVGDRVILSLEDSTGGYVTVVITEEHSEPENLIFSRIHPTAVALIDKTIDDEVDVDVCGKHQKVCVVQIEKGKVVKTDNSEPTQEYLTEQTFKIKPDVSKEKSPLEKSHVELTSKQPLAATCKREASTESPVQQEIFQQSSLRQQTSNPEIAEIYPDPRNSNPEQISKYLKLIVAEHGPMIAEHAYHIYLEKARIKRLGGQIRRIFEQCMSDLTSNFDLLVADHSESKSQSRMVVKTHTQDDYVIREHLGRSIERIPWNELCTVAKKIKDSRPGLDKGELIREVMEKYGFKRLTKKTETILNKVLRGLEFFKE
ncbi:MAG: AAA domain-containing protein [Candidatus Scalindua sp.]|nr:AAA domain-containing protein [Candidatus Scalindua sp.]